MQVKTQNAPSRLWRGITLVLLLLGASGVSLPMTCGAESVPDAGGVKLKRWVLSNYVAIVDATYQDTVAATKELSAAIGNLVTAPAESTLTAARNAWLAARVCYSQSEAFRFYDGPIDQLEGQINSWPIDENYIDYVAGDAGAGLINSVSNFPVLSRDLILALNQKEGKKNISTGFHAIEFLLWGQPVEPGAGKRSWRDYADGAPLAERRRQYLRLVTDLLVENLEAIAADWAGGVTGNYRSHFLALEPDAALAHLLKGIGALSGPEMAGERLTSAYETREREEQQDCFSDNSRNDLIDDALGIQNVYFGNYRSPRGRNIQGPGLHDLLLRADPEFAGTMAAQIRAAVAAARALPPLFDQALLGPKTAPGRVAIKAAIQAFQAESDLIAQAAGKLALKLNL